jgi:hypothetical protein
MPNLKSHHTYFCSIAEQVPEASCIDYVLDGASIMAAELGSQLRSSPRCPSAGLLGMQTGTVAFTARTAVARTGKNLADIRLGAAT